MNAFLDKLKLILSARWTGFVIICLAVIARVIQLVFYFNLHVDLSYQVLATRNLANGHGISSAFVSVNDLSTVLYEPLINWPPGYSLLFLPFYILCNGDYLAAGMLISLLSGVALIFITRALLNLLDVPLYLINLFTLLTSFYIYFFYYINSSDAVAIPFFLTGVYFTIRLLKTENRPFRTCGFSTKTQKHNCSMAGGTASPPKIWTTTVTWIWYWAIWVPIVR